MHGQGYRWTLRTGGETVKGRRTWQNWHRWHAWHGGVYGTIGADGMHIYTDMQTDGCVIFRQMTIVTLVGLRNIGINKGNESGCSRRCTVGGYVPRFKNLPINGNLLLQSAGMPTTLTRHKVNDSQKNLSQLRAADRAATQLRLS
jgi:hypothetical protein